MANGKWVVRVPFSRCKEYGCAKPVVSRELAAIGSIWECECGQQWKITKWTSDQREGDYPSWQEVNLQKSISTDPY